MTDPVLEHNRALVAYLERLLRDLEHARADQRQKDSLASTAIGDRLRCERELWAYKARVTELEHELREARCYATLLEAERRAEQARVARPARLDCLARQAEGTR